MDKNVIAIDRKIDMLCTAFGNETLALFKDDKVIEIMLNSDGTLWIDRLGEGCIKTDIHISSESALRVIQVVASMQGPDVTCNAKNPRISAVLPETGSRFQGSLPPIVARPSFVIRKKASLIFSLDDYVKSDILTVDQAKFLKKAAAERLNILCIGGTQSGKTTFCNAILKEITDRRIIIIEDTEELQCEAPNKERFLTSPHVDMMDLLQDTMRYRPDSIFVGEVRKGSVALELLKAWNSGHPGGGATIHADSALKGLKKLEQYISEVAVTSQKDLIAEAVNVVVFIQKTSVGRKVMEIGLVKGVFQEQYKIDFL